MDFKETMVSTETIFEGKIITVLKDEVTLPNGKLASREVVRHPGGVAILALDDEYNAYLVRQYRYPMEMELLELPAGKLDMDGEDSMNAAAVNSARRRGSSQANCCIWAIFWPHLDFVTRHFICMSHRT